MLSRTLKTAVLALIAAGTLAGSAQAAVVNTDNVKLTGTGYDFGGSFWAAGAPTGNGEVHWHYENGDIRPHLKGYIHLNDAAGTCGRMKIEYFDGADNLLTTVHGGSVCMDDDSHDHWEVDRQDYEDERIEYIRVHLQKQTVSGWSTVQWDEFRGTPNWELYKLTADGVDFGMQDFALGAPMADGYTTWDIDNGVATANAYGYIHLNNSSGVCARLKFRYLTEGGLFLSEHADEEHCAPDNGHHSWWVDFEPTGTNKVGQVRVQLQTLAANGNWETAESRLIDIAE